MKRSRWALFGTILILAAVATAGLWLRKSITLVDGERTYTLNTMALTVGDLTREAELVIGPKDQLQPSLREWLSDGDVVTIRRARLVQVLADGVSHMLVTTERRPARLLAMAGVTLAPGDRIYSAGVLVEADKPLPRSSASTLQVRRGVPVTVESGEAVHTFVSAAPTVGQALWQAGISLYAADRITPTLDTPLTAPITITLLRSRPLTVQVAGGSHPIRSAAGTIGEALAEAGLALQGQDYSMPPEGEPIPADGKVRLVRVQEEVILEEKPLPFESVTEPDPNLLIDQRGVTQPGAYGLATVRTRVRYEDGQEVSRQVEEEWVALEPQPRVLGYGTKIEILTLDTPSGPLEYWRAVPMYATSYSPCRIFPDRCDSVTSSGATLQKGVAAVTLRHYRLMAGSQVYVPGYGVATILDVGGGIPGRNWIDLGYSDDDYQSWHDWVTVYFLTPVPPENLILYIMN